MSETGRGRQQTFLKPGYSPFSKGTRAHGDPPRRCFATLPASERAMRPHLNPALSLSVASLPALHFEWHEERKARFPVIRIDLNDAAMQLGDFGRDVEPEAKPLLAGLGAMAEEGQKQLVD